MAELSDTAHSHSATVCVVDGNAEERQALAELLVRLDAPVASFASAEDLLSRLGDTDIALIVASVRLPGINGIELLRQLRERGVAAPMILISGESDLKTAVDAMHAGAVDFIEKPIIDRVVLRRAKHALASAAAAAVH